MRLSEQTVDVDGIAVRLSTLDRVLWPATGTTKAQLIEYYAQMGQYLLPHVAGRPLTLRRFPEGVDGPSFFQTRAPAHPDWIRVQRMHTFRSGKEVDAVVIDSLPGLLWAANLSSIELHPYLGRADGLEHPTTLVFDLDPGAPATILDACNVALLIRESLDALGIRSYPKVTGGAGVHVIVPLAAGHTYDRTKRFARAVTDVLTRAYPDTITNRMPRQHRTGRVFIDWSQNDAGKSTVAPYSVRGGRIPTVAMPVTWAAVERVAETREPRGLVFVPDRAVAELDETGGGGEAEVTTGQHLP